MAKITMNPKKLKKGMVRTTDKNTGKSKDKAGATVQKAADMLGGSSGDARDAINKRKNEARTDASGHVRREQ
jgi:hypothetical protein